MIRPIAASLATLAMAVTVISGVVIGDVASDVIASALVSAAAFAVAGAAVGWVLDDVVTGQVRVAFEERVRWYTDAVDGSGANQGNDTEQTSSSPSQP